MRENKLWFLVVRFMRQIIRHCLLNLRLGIVFLELKYSFLSAAVRNYTNVANAARIASKVITDAVLRNWQQTVAVWLAPVSN